MEMHFMRLIVVHALYRVKTEELGYQQFPERYSLSLMQGQCQGGGYSNRVIDDVSSAMRQVRERRRYGALVLSPMRHVLVHALRREV